MDILGDVIGEVDWVKLDTSGRGKLIQRLNSLSVLGVSSVDNSEYITDFDIFPDKALIQVPNDILLLMCSEADEILSSKMVMPAPSRDSHVAMYSCSSSTDGNTNYSVKISRGAQTCCQCHAYRVHHICSHFIAASHINGSLYSFIRWHRYQYPKRKNVSFSTFSSSLSEKPHMGFKPRQRKRTRNIVVETQDQCMSSKERKVCDVDHTAVDRLVFLKNHPQVKICYTCSQNIDLCNDLQIAISVYDYRCYFDRGVQRHKLSLKKQYHYSHITCYKPKRSIGDVHLCQDVDVEVKSELMKHKVKFHISV